MATRATISIKTTSKGQPAVETIYQHWDGYPTGLGVTLRDHYTNPAKVQELLAQGEASSVRETLAESSFCHRDWGVPKKSCRARVFTDPQKAAKYFGWCEWHYIFDPKTETWECAPSKGHGENTLEGAFCPLEEVIVKEEKKEAEAYAKRMAQIEAAEKEAREVKAMVKG